MTTIRYTYGGGRRVECAPVDNADLDLIVRCIAHTCALPPGERFGVGTVGRCKECGRYWRVPSNSFGSWSLIYGWQAKRFLKKLAKETA